MRSLVIKTLAGAGLGPFTLTANAQYQPLDYPYQDRNHERSQLDF